MGYRVAVVGATGNVGREMLNILAEREFPVDEIVALAIRKSLGTEVLLRRPDPEDARTSTPSTSPAGTSRSSPSARTPPRSTPRSPPRPAAWSSTTPRSTATTPTVPLIVPEVNPDAIAGYARKNIIANPNCSTAQLVVALKPLHDRARIKRVVVSTYQSVSGAGKEAMDELWLQTKGMYVPGQEVAPKVFPKQIAFNVIPHIDVFMEDGSTEEEWKMVAETKKILDPSIKVTATCVRVPVFVGHSEAVNIEFEDSLDEDEARDILREAPGVLVVDKREDGGYITPVECVGEYATYVSRIRKDPTVENGLLALGRRRQPPQGRRAQRRADRRAPRPPRAEEGLSCRMKTTTTAGLSPNALRARAVIFELGLPVELEEVNLADAAAKVGDAPPLQPQHQGAGAGGRRLRPLGKPRHHRLPRRAARRSTPPIRSAAPSSTSG